MVVWLLLSLELLFACHLWWVTARDFYFLWLLGTQVFNLV